MVKNKIVKISYNVPVSVLKEGEYFIAYSPALDISTSANDFDRVKKRFEEVVEIFFEEIMEKGSLEKVLSDLGWKKNRSQWDPPTVISHNILSLSVNSNNNLHATFNSN